MCYCFRGKVLFLEIHQNRKLASSFRHVFAPKDFFRRVLRFNKRASTCIGVNIVKDLITRGSKWEIEGKLKTLFAGGSGKLYRHVL